MDRRLVYRYARAALMDRGHSPQEIESYRWSTILDFLAVHDVLDAPASLGGMLEG